MTGTTIRPTPEGWDWLRAIHESLYARPDVADLVVSITHDRDMPRADGSPPDVRAGTTTLWTWPGRVEDDVDHLWEARRLERRAAALRGLHPCPIDADGCSDAECWTEISAAGFSSITSWSLGEERDAFVEVRHARDGPGAWTAALEVVAAIDMPLVDAATLTAADGVGILERLDIAVDGFEPVDARWDAGTGNVVVTLPVEAIAVLVRSDDDRQDGFD